MSSTSDIIHEEKGAFPDKLENPRAASSMPASGTALAIGAFATTLTTLSLSLMEWRGVTTANVFIPNFFFLSGIGMIVTAQWEMSFGNGFCYTVFSAFGFFYAGYGAILTPAFGVKEMYGGDETQYNNALGLWLIVWTVFAVVFLIASIPMNIVNILIYVFVVLGFLFVAISYFAAADGHAAASIGAKKAGGVFCFLAGLVGWYLTLQMLIKDSMYELPLGDTSKYFHKTRRKL